ncbi:MAG: M23 family peptidase [Leptospira sp.]|nr:M23 family peptidase [Leptospira sp.]
MRSFFLRIGFCLLAGTAATFGLRSEVPEIPPEEVGFPLPYLSPITGTFAEIRNHNLHLGSDFKSYGLNGHDILATFDGYVDEISYSKTGYGLSLNFYNPKYKIKSKYAHLHSFQGTLYELELLRKALLLMGDPNGFQLKLPEKMFQANKGIPIGKTGETGSGISHLHLEFRTDKGIVNPLYFPELHQKDITPPTILSLIIESENLPQPLQFLAKEKSSGKYELYYESGERFETLPITGKVKIRVGGYDIIRSRNKNNIYGLDLIVNQKLEFTRNFAFIPYSQSTQKHQFYDVNRSSLAPPSYIYHVYEQPKDFKEEGFSIDMNKFLLGDKVNLEVRLRDASKNFSNVSFAFIHESNTTKMELPSYKNKGFKYESLDKNLSIDLSKNEVSGNGRITIEEVKNENLSFTLPKTLPLKGKIYQIIGSNFSWKGEGSGEFKTNFPTTNKESLYFYDTSIRRLASLSQKRKSNGFSFKISKFGYLFVLSDESPPTIFPMTSLARHIELPGVRNQCIEDRFYGLGDTGSGFKTNVELLLDGQSYPYEYDPDRKAIRVSIPKSLSKEKPYLLLEVRAFDFAGNASEPYLDLIATSGWLKEDYASCPVIE